MRGPWRQTEGFHTVGSMRKAPRDEDFPAHHSVSWRHSKCTSQLQKEHMHAQCRCEQAHQQQKEGRKVRPGSFYNRDSIKPARKTRSISAINTRHPEMVLVNFSASLLSCTTHRKQSAPPTQETRLSTCFSKSWSFS